MSQKTRKETRTWLQAWLKPRRRKVAKTQPACKHYTAHKESARTLIVTRVEYWNTFYRFSYKRIAIRNQKRRWGSCSSLGNLNFNYKLIFLPHDLVDYIIVHELCHLAELNHGPRFWEKVAQTLPDYRERIEKLRYIEKHCGTSPAALQTITLDQRYQPTAQVQLRSGMETN